MPKSGVQEQVNGLQALEESTFPIGFHTGFKLQRDYSTADPLLFKWFCGPPICDAFHGPGSATVSVAAVGVSPTASFLLVPNMREPAGV